METTAGSPSNPEDDALASDAALRRALAARGVPPDEIARLLGSTPRSTVLDAHTSTGSVPPAPSDSVVSPPFVPVSSIRFPEFREASASAVEEADTLLRTAALARRRGDYKKAAEACWEALLRVPCDSSALELYGDILQSGGRVDDALAAYHRATEADPRRTSAERKYAELLLLQDRSVQALQGRAIQTNPHLAVLLSALCPGAGQFYNGQTGKAAGFFAATIGGLIALFWSPIGFTGGRGLPSGPGALLLLLAAIYIASLVDANLSARSPRHRSHGWDV